MSLEIENAEPRDFVIYGRPDCVWCNLTKRFFDREGMTYYYHDCRDADHKLTDAGVLLHDLMTISFGLNTYTYPQIFTWEGDRIGGYSDLMKWLRENRN